MPPFEFNLGVTNSTRRDNTSRPQSSPTGSHSSNTWKWPYRSIMDSVCEVPPPALSAFTAQSLKVRRDQSPFSAELIANFFFLSMQRSHDQMSRGWHRRSLSPWDPPPHELSSSSDAFPPSTSRTTNPQPHRSIGDGLDYRRPIMSQPTADVIDLTNSPPHARLRPFSDRATRASRPPRFPRDIIDLDDQDNASDVAVRGNSPEIELLYARSVPVSARLTSRPSGVIEFARARRGGETARPSVSPPRYFRNNPPRPLTGAWQEQRDQAHSRRQTENDTIRRRMAEDLSQATFGHGPRRLLHDIAVDLRPPDDDTLFGDGHGVFVAPGPFNYHHAAFAVGPGPAPRTQPPVPTYDAPSLPRDGFTRSPTEDDILVCPNCEEELGVGDDDLKRQVWVVKSCGHVSI